MRQVTTTSGSPSEKEGLGMCSALNTRRALQDGGKREETQAKTAMRQCKGDVQRHLLNSYSYLVLKKLLFHHVPLKNVVLLFLHLQFGCLWSFSINYCICILFLTNREGTLRHTPCDPCYPVRFLCSGNNTILNLISTLSFIYDLIMSFTNCH
jgi:hypothetical protein